MWGARKQLADDLAYEQRRNELLRQHLADATAEAATWKAQAEAADRIAGDLITRTRELNEARAELDKARDDLALSRQAATERAGLLEEARDALEVAGLAGAHGDDWPAIAPAIRNLATECAGLRASTARLTEQLFDALGYQPEQRELLTLEVTK